MGCHGLHSSVTVTLEALELCCPVAYLFPGRLEVMVAFVLALP